MSEYDTSTAPKVIPPQNPDIRLDIAREAEEKQALQDFNDQHKTKGEE